MHGPEIAWEVKKASLYKSWLLFAVMLVLVIVGCVAIQKLRNWMKEEGMI